MSSPYIVEIAWANASRLSCDDQFELAKRIAANVGYVLVPEPPIDAGPTIEDRVKSLEVRMSHLMPDKSDDI